MPSKEIDTRGIANDVLRSGKSLFVPYCEKSRMEMVKIINQDDLESLPIDKWGIPNPSLSYKGKKRPIAYEDGLKLDLILVPGVAFDRSGNRLGHGMGYYDRYISRCNQLSKPHLIALALSDQIIDDTIPHDDLDHPMDYILHPRGIVHVEQNQ